MKLGFLFYVDISFINNRVLIINIVKVKTLNRKQKPPILKLVAFRLIKYLGLDLTWLDI